MVQIVQHPDHRLREAASTVSAAEIASSRLNKVLSSMRQALSATPDGVALAAPQIGVGWRIFIVSGRLFPDKAGRSGKDLIFINPKIKRASRRKQWAEEGCLSVRWLYGLVPRSEKLTIEALSDTGRKFTRDFSGLLSQICQHEVEHLDGVLFIDKAKNLREMKPSAESSNHAL